MQDNNDNLISDTANHIEVSLKPVIDKLNTWVTEAISMLPNMIVAILILLLFIFLARFIKRLINRYLTRSVQTQSAVNIIANIVYLIVLILGVILALEVVNQSEAVGKILAAAGIVGVALGFAFQDTAANFISGTFMAFRKNFKIGDLIETNDVMAVVEHIDLRSTKLKSLDGYQVIIPNKEIFQNTLINYNRYSNRRIDLVCGVGYESDLEQVEEIALNVIRKLNDIKKSPSPQFFYTDFGDSSINFVLRFWIDFLNMPDYLDAKHSAIKALKKEFDAHDINIPFPIRTLDFGKNNLTILNDKQENK